MDREAVGGVGEREVVEGADDSAGRPCMMIRTGSPVVCISTHEMALACWESVRCTSIVVGGVEVLGGERGGGRGEVRWSGWSGCCRCPAHYVMDWGPGNCGCDALIALLRERRYGQHRLDTSGLLW